MRLPNRFTNLAWEVSLRSADHIPALTRELGAIGGISRVHLTHKRDTRPPEAVRAIRAALPPHTQISTTIALSRYTRIADVVADVVLLQTSSELSCNEILIVSGDNKGLYDSTRLLRELVSIPANLSVSVAYTCHRDADRCGLERQRLVEKLQAAGARGVANVYLQLSDDLDLIEREISWIRAETSSRSVPVGLRGCLLLPSRALLVSLARAPWPGVSLSAAFLGSLEGAQRANSDLWQGFERLRVEPLVVMLPYPSVRHEGWAALPGDPS